ncbi:flagellar basal body rod protein FlgC [Aminipila luticellarii]|uniref:Flagellar basal-body rod protein FlgC n=1 Tax=Aminipila luticellarii TaxID=2507160 RepID=A0A410PSW4_9FIRM|nr:flagellar basal body rod protein FlgC [Aminipila luticellarii]QAT41989.1 flagellar basal body rod protein FlgC [Aminipila luticellarii]
MSFLNSMNISASALTAQRQRLDIISENVANIDTTRTEAGGPYRRKMVVFEDKAGDVSFKDSLNQAILEKDEDGKMIRRDYSPGVRVSGIIEDQSDFKTEYNPEHPDADANGYVRLPNVNMLEETIDSMAATRSYQANVTVLNAVKMMAQKALEIGK